MNTKEDVMRILDLSTADFDTLEGIAELQRRVEKVHALFTEDKIRQTTDRLSGETADDPLSVLSEIDAILDEKRGILKNAKCDLKPTPWDEIKDVQRKWLIPNWIPENTVTMFTGQGGAGKSWLTLQMVCQTACGYRGAFLDPSFVMPSDADESIESYHIVIATYEDEPEEIKRRLQALASGMEWIPHLT